MSERLSVAIAGGGIGGRAAALSLLRSGVDLQVYEQAQVAFRRYEAVRLPRASKIQSLSAQNKVRFHLPAGPEQEERERVRANWSTDWSIDAVAWIYGHDAGIVDDAAD